MLAWLRAYLAHPDPRVAVANRMAAVLGGNGPFYPLYVGWVAGWGGMPQALLTLLSCPVFLSAPLLARRHPVAGRLLLMAAAIGNTIFCTQLFGEASGVELFLVPCVILAAMIFRADERVYLVPLLLLPLILFYALHDHYGAWSVYSDAAYHALFFMNAFSVGCLTVLMGWTIANDRSHDDVRTL